MLCCVSLFRVKPYQFKSYTSLHHGNPYCFLSILHLVSGRVAENFKHCVTPAQSKADPHLGHGVWRRSLVQKQERNFLVIIMCCNMERGETVL